MHDKPLAKPPPALHLSSLVAFLARFGNLGGLLSHLLEKSIELLTACHWRGPLMSLELRHTVLDVQVPWTIEIGK